MAEQVEIESTLDSSGTVKGLLEIEESTVKAAKKVSKLQDEYNDLSKTLNKLDAGADEWEDVYKEVTKTEKALKKANAELDETTNSSRAATGSISEMTNSLETLQNEISQVAVGSKEFDDLSVKIRKLDGELTTANESLNGMSSEDKASRIGQLAGGLGNVAASAALIGGEDSAIGEFFGGLQGAIGIMVGVQGAIEAITAAKKLLTLAAVQSTATQSAEAAAMGATAVAAGAQTVGTGAATTATWALNAALLANPIFWIVAVIMAVVAAFAIFSASSKTAGDEQKKLNEQLEREGELIESNRKARERANSELLNEIANKEKLLKAEKALIEGTSERTKEQEAQLVNLNKQLGNIDQESIDILGEETQKRMTENTKQMTTQLKAAQKGITAVYQEDWGAPDFDYNTVRGYFNDVNALQLKAQKLYNQANAATTDEERDEFLKRASTIEEQVTSKSARIQKRLAEIKDVLGSDGTEAMQKVIDDVEKFGEQANESAGLISEYQKALDDFNTDNMVSELEDELETQEEIDRKAEEAIEKRKEAVKNWQSFIEKQNGLREELLLARLSDQDRELHELEVWTKEREKLVRGDAGLAAELAEESQRQLEEIKERYAALEVEKAKALAAGLLEIDRQLTDDRAQIAALRIAAITATSEEEVNAQLEAWEAALAGTLAISDQELAALKASLLIRRDVRLQAIEQEQLDRQSAADRTRADENADAVAKIEELKLQGLGEIEAAQQLAELKMSILAKYNAEVKAANEAAALEKRAAQKEYDDAEVKADLEQKERLAEINQEHTDKILSSLETIAAALAESVGQFEGSLGSLGNAVAAGVGQLGGAVQGFSDQIAKIKEATKDGATLSPEEMQEMKESTAAAVSAVVGAAGAVAQDIVSAIAESNAAKAEERLAGVEERTTKETEMIDSQLSQGLISQEDADKKKKALDFKAAKEKYNIQKAAFEQDKKAKIASAVISGITGAVSAFAGAMQLGPIAGPIVGGLLAAFVGTMTGINVAKIKKTKFGGAAPKPATGGGAPSATPSAINPTSLLPTGSSDNNEAGVNQGGQQNNENGGNSQITVKAIVVETDITDTQNQVSAIESRSEFD
jgi:hypothetical protein